MNKTQQIANKQIKDKPRVSSKYMTGIRSLSANKYYDITDDVRDPAVLDRIKVKLKYRNLQSVCNT